MEVIKSWEVDVTQGWAVFLSKFQDLDKNPRVSNIFAGDLDKKRLPRTIHGEILSDEVFHPTVKASQCMQIRD